MDRYSLLAFELKHLQERGKCVSQILTLHNQVNHPMFEKVLGSLKSFWKLCPNRLLNHPRPCKSDHRLWLRNDDITQHGNTGRNSTCSGVGQYGDIGNFRLVQFSQGRARFGHLHQGEDAFLHPRSSRGAEDAHTDSLFYGPLYQTGDLLSHHRSQTSAHKIKLENNNHGWLAFDLCLPPEDGILLPCLLLGFFHSRGITFRILEL